MMHQSKTNNLCSLLVTSVFIDGDNSPSSRWMSDVVTVISRCSRRVEVTRKPVREKSALEEFSTKSVSSKSSGVRLVINARTICLCEPMVSVKQTAGRSFVVVRSSKERV